MQKHGGISRRLSQAEIEGGVRKIIVNRLGISDEIFQWGDIKLPKGKLWEKDSLFHIHDKAFMFYKISFYDADPDLYVRFKARKSTAYLTIKNYKEHIFFEIYKRSIDLGRHFEDGMKRIYRDLGMKTGKRYL